MRRENSTGTKALLGGLGARSTWLSAKGHNHPSWHPAAVAMIGAERNRTRWKWKTTLEGEFQGPSFDPVRTTRYTGEVTGTYPFSKQIEGIVGAGIKFGMRSTTAYPIIGLTYKTHLWDINITYPYDLTAAYKLFDKDKIGVFLANTLAKTYRAEKAFGRKDAICNFVAQFAGVFWKHAFSHKTSCIVACGWNVHTNITVGNSRNNHRKQVVNSSGGLLLSFGLKTAL